MSTPTLLIRNCWNGNMMNQPWSRGLLPSHGQLVDVSRLPAISSSQDYQTLGIWIGRPWESLSLLHWRISVPDQPNCRFRGRCSHAQTFPASSPVRSRRLPSFPRLRHRLRHLPLQVLQSLEEHWELIGWILSILTSACPLFLLCFSNVEATVFVAPSLQQLEKHMC